MDKVTKAEEQIEIFLENWDEASYLWKGHFYYLRGDFGTAESLWQIAKKQDPEDAISYHNLATVNLATADQLPLWRCHDTTGLDFVQHVASDDLDVQEVLVYDQQNRADDNQDDTRHGVTGGEVLCARGYQADSSRFEAATGQNSRSSCKHVAPPFCGL